jgi:hypothetical protein
MKLKVCTKKGKQAFRRAGFNFNPNPIEIEVSDEVAEIIKNEAMLIVEEVEEVEEVKEVKEVKEVEKVEVEEVIEVVKPIEDLAKLKFIPIKKGRPKKK